MLRPILSALSIALLHLSAFAQSDALFAQAVQHGLEQTHIAYSPSRFHWLLMNVDSRIVIASRWPAINVPQPLGSLTKPVLVYAASGGATPHIVAPSTQPGCGGGIALHVAIAFSCNAYFTAFATRIDASLLHRTASILTLPAPPADATGEDLIGLTTRWPIPPSSIAIAYAHIIAAHNAQIEQGMSLAARSGTARALQSHNVLAKTGTAGCAGQCFHHGNGFVVVLAPAAAPRYLLLVEAEGTTGAHTAELAEPLLQTLEHLHAW